MSLPDPVPGLVIRHGFLWAADAARGQDAGKERPSVIVMALKPAGSNATRTYVLPITHSAPDDKVEAMKIPDSVAASAGLDAAQSWVVLSDFNEFIWPGFDLGIVPGRNPRTVAHGFLTAGFFNRLRDRWLELDAKGKSTGVSRD